MPAPPTLDNEPQRLAAVHELSVLDTPNDKAFERLTQLTRDLFVVPVALVSLIDQERQWFKSHQGIEMSETDRSISFCDHAIAQDGPFIVEDTLEDERFADNPLVTSPPHFRFYAGYPIRPLNGMAVGTLCIIDYQPRQFSERDLKLLGRLAGQVEELFRHHKLQIELTQTANLMHKEQQLLKVLHHGITDYQALMSGERLWTFLTEALSELTDSEYALIGEVLPGDTSNALKLNAIKGPLWSPEARHHIEQLLSGDRVLKNPDSLLGRVFARGEVVIDNDVNEHTQRSEFPLGQVQFDNYLGVPIFSSGQLIGMFAIANSRQQLDQHLLEWLQPFTDTCVLLINLYRQMAEREQVMQDLANTRDQAERANQAKSEFLSSMSHELRTPLNAILGFAQVLGHNPRAPLNDKQKRQVNQIEKSGHHLLSLINDVLDLAKIEASQLSLSIEAIALNSLFEDACSTLEANVGAAGITLTCTLPDSDLKVSADYTRTKQILLNLLSNAIKYNVANGRVDILAQRQKDVVRISVSDTGPGVETDRFSELFEPFNRLDAEGSHVEGTGIGLSITRELVERMHGEIGVDSQPGHGATFWFTLPVSTSPDAERPAGPEQRRLPETANQQTLLYIEDNPANQHLMEDIVDAMEGVTLRTASSAEIGLEMMRYAIPAVVVMDLHLPGMSGYEALTKLRETPIYREVRVIALSANALPSDIKRGLRAGFDAYLTKPIDIKQFTDTLNPLLGAPTRQEP
ncbi:GAF domain-containing protein [Halomonas sp. Mc5H-6]|uniref:GAF domain-containing protein n=1 Tax=Halomonas sp. Mc5H-6 TaxID=2954500 RepID=UPI002096DF21|nr:GAF domain-containing protein [Halomonas sp. Mc5H-6]MCO7245539.1 ATP-binding protein [Halomonas sp. Mc5H-6]